MAAPVIPMSPARTSSTRAAEMPSAFAAARCARPSPDASAMRAIWSGCTAAFSNNARPTATTFSV